MDHDTPPKPSSTRREVNLVVAGFSKQKIISLPEIHAAINNLPRQHLIGLRQIIYDPGLIPEIYEKQKHKAGGPIAEFIQKSRQIIFYELGDPSQFKHVLYHEIGHHVFYIFLNSRMKKNWVMDIHQKHPCLTLYGATSASEDFAETYAIYATSGKAIDEKNEKLLFMRRIFSNPGLYTKMTNQVTNS